MSFGIIVVPNPDGVLFWSLFMHLFRVSWLSRVTRASAMRWRLVYTAVTLLYCQPVSRIEKSSFFYAPSTVVIYLLAIHGSVRGLFQLNPVGFEKLVKFSELFSRCKKWIFIPNDDVICILEVLLYPLLLSCIYLFAVLLLSLKKRLPAIKIIRDFARNEINRIVFFVD